MTFAAVQMRTLVCSRNFFFLAYQDILKTRLLDTNLLASVHFHHKQKPPAVFQSLSARSTAQAALYLSPANSVPIYMRDIFYTLCVLVEGDK